MEAAAPLVLSVPGIPRVPGKVARQSPQQNFCYLPNFLNIQPLSLYFKFLATESLRIQVERKVSSAGG